jgi:hypothetical protein
MLQANWVRLLHWQLVIDMNYVLFWDITRCRMVFTDGSAQRIGPIFKDQKSKKEKLFFLLGLLTLEDGTDTFSRNVGKQLSYDQGCGVGLGVVELESESEGILCGVGVIKNVPTPTSI